MRAALDDMRIIQHKDLVGVTHGVKLVSDHDHSFAMRKSGKSSLELGFVFRIDARGGLVEDNDRCVFQYRAGD